MILLLVRHADAPQRDPASYPDDTQRPLTGKGMKIQAKVSRRLRKRGIRPDVILSSPWVRAWQSGMILAEGTRSAGAPVECAALASEPDLEALQAAVGPRQPEETVALVGHEPWIGELASLLLTGEPHRLAVDFPKSGVLALELSEVAAGAATLRFFLRPK
jgi:phosphohistidine phosphatase